jgi:hypothetical protein
MFTPMAVGMIFGLLVSTFLTLGLVPLLYALFYNVDFSGVTAAAAIGEGETPPAKPAAPDDRKDVSTAPQEAE